jgi:hypothetical protein
VDALAASGSESVRPGHARPTRLSPTYRFLAAYYAHIGAARRRARTIVARLRAITPLVVPSDLPYRNPEDRELLLSGLRLAIGETVT